MRRRKHSSKLKRNERPKRLNKRENRSYWENKYEPINRKGFKSAEKDYQFITDAKKKRKKNNFKRFNEGKKYKVLHLTDNKKKNNYLSSKEMNNYRKGLKKR